MKNTSIAIDDDIPLPTSALYRARNGITTAILALDVGQSFFVQREQADVSSRIGQLKRKKDNRMSEQSEFTTRKATENGVSGVRVWRIA